MLRTNRRMFLAGSAAFPVAATATATADSSAHVAADLDKYIGFGNKQAGGVGDIACGNWLASELENLGFVVERQTFQVPYFAKIRSELTLGDLTAQLWPQPIVVDTGAHGIDARLVLVDAAGQAAGAMEGAIALIELPYGRWSSALAKPVRDPINAAFAGGAIAAVVITNGPTGKAIALNADGRQEMFTGPVGLVAPEDAQPFRNAARSEQTARLVITGETGRRQAFNFIGRMDRGQKNWLVISTPRSGWHKCAGERGPGVAAWLWLARWASTAISNYNLAFLCNSGHEYENLGAAEALRAIAPKPEHTHFWLHLGANVAARDWHETVGQWKVLPGVDSQRFLSVSPSVLPLAREVFKGQPGLEAPYSTDTLTAGELTEIVHAGYPAVAGVFGIHRYHHVAEDDDRCVSAENVVRTTAAFQKLLESIV